MERIVLYNVKHSENIIKSASNMRIKSIVLSEDMTSKTLKDVLDSAKDYKSGDDIFYNEAKAGIVIFCNVTDKHMDKLLFELRNGSSKADYKAVQTKTNSHWTITRILAQMERESMEYRRSLSAVRT